MGADPAGFRFGIEAEFALVDVDGTFRDFSTLTYGQVQRIVDRLPDHGDPELTRGDLAVKLTRWYVEGDERFDQQGRFLRCVPKGLETRTPIRSSVDATVRQLDLQTAQLAAAAGQEGFRLAAIGRNPWRDYRPEPPYNGWELGLHERRPEYAAPEAYMVGYGPDLNLSHPDWGPDRVLDVGRKLTALSPVLVPFSFSSPFAGGQPVALSTRTLIRAPVRPSARAYLPAARPPVGVAARIPAEVGRIEFKAFDALPANALYRPCSRCWPGSRWTARWPTGPTALTRARTPAPPAPASTIPPSGTGPNGSSTPPNGRWPVPSAGECWSRSGTCWPGAARPRTT
jgi:Glutamate-cysteine ligase family 2(GCS2)